MPSLAPTHAITAPSWLAVEDEQTRAELDAIPAEQALLINLDIPRAIADLRAVLPQLQHVEQEQARRFREAPSGQIERLERYAAVLERSHFECSALQATAPDSSPLIEELATLRKRVLSCVNMLVVTELLDGRELAPYERVQSHRSLNCSVVGIVMVCRRHWDTLQNKTPLQLAELDRAEQLTREVAVLLQRGRRPAPALARALLERRQAFTLLLREYAELRRVAAYLYPRREAERRVPSLFRKAPGARQRAKAIRSRSGGAA